jgi:hypothetical protein
MISCCRAVARMVGSGRLQRLLAQLAQVWKLRFSSLRAIDRQARLPPRRAAACS